MKLKARVFVLVSLLAASGICLAAQAAGSPADTVSKVMEVTGIAAESASMPAYISAIFGQQKAEFGDEAYAKILGIMSDSFSQENINRRIRDQLVSRYNGDYCARILSAYQKKLFLDITARENEALSIENEAKIKDFDYSKLSPERDAILDEFLDATKTIDTMETMVLGALDIYLKSYNLFLPKDGKIAPEALDGVKEQTRAALRSKENRANMKLRMAQLYESFSDEDLKEYFAFYLTDEGAWLNENFMAGFQKALESSMKDAAGKIIAEFKLSAQNT